MREDCPTAVSSHPTSDKMKLFNAPLAILLATSVASVSSAPAAEAGRLLTDYEIAQDFWAQFPDSDFAHLREPETEEDDAEPEARHKDELVVVPGFGRFPLRAIFPVFDSGLRDGEEIRYLRPDQLQKQKKSEAGIVEGQEKTLKVRPIFPVFDSGLRDGEEIRYLRPDQLRR